MHKTKRNGDGKKQGLVLCDTSKQTGLDPSQCRRFIARQKLDTAMTAIETNDLLFDDFSLLAKVIGERELKLASPVNDCDCISHSSPTGYQKRDTDQITAAANPTH